MLDGVGDTDFLLVDLHRKADDAENGPSIRRLRGNRDAVVGEVILEGREIRLLREGKLYIDVHTRERLTGALRVDLSLPQED